MDAELDDEEYAAKMGKTIKKKTSSGSIDVLDLNDEVEEESVEGPFTLPLDLRKVLEDDIDSINFQKKLHKLPKRKTLHQILMEFKEKYTVDGVTSLPALDPETNEQPVMVVGGYNLSNVSFQQVY